LALLSAINKLLSSEAKNKIGLFIDDGKTQIELYFNPPYYNVGIIVSILSTLVLISVLILNIYFSNLKKWI